MASISKRKLANGGARYDVNYREPSGTKRRRTFAKSYDAHQFAREVEVNKERGQFIDPMGGKTLFGNYARAWLEMQTHYAPALKKP